MVISIRELRKREAAGGPNPQEPIGLQSSEASRRPIPPWMQRTEPSAPSHTAPKPPEGPPESPVPPAGEPLASTSLPPAHAQLRQRQLIARQTRQAPSALPGEYPTETASPPLVAESIRQAEGLDAGTARPRGDGVLKFARFLESL